MAVDLLEGPYDRLGAAWGDAMTRTTERPSLTERLRDRLAELLAPFDVPVPDLEVVDLRDTGMTGVYTTGAHRIRICSSLPEAQAFDCLTHEAAHALHETLDGPIPKGAEHGARFESFVRQLVAGRREQTRRTATRSAKPASGKVKATKNGRIYNGNLAEPQQTLEFTRGQVLDASHPSIAAHLAACAERGESPWFVAA